MTVVVLALQGAFIEHEQVLSKLGVNCVELRKSEDLDQPYQGLILPGWWRKYRSGKAFKGIGNV